MNSMAENLNLPPPDESGKLVDAAFGALERAIITKGIGDKEVIQAIIMLRATHTHLGVLQEMLVAKGVIDPVQMNLALAKAFAEAAKELSTPQLVVPGGKPQ